MGSSPRPSPQLTEQVDRGTFSVSSATWTTLLNSVTSPSSTGLGRASFPHYGYDNNMPASLDSASIGENPSSSREYKATFSESPSSSSSTLTRSSYVAGGSMSQSVLSFGSAGPMAVHDYIHYPASATSFSSATVESIQQPDFPFSYGLYESTTLPPRQTGTVS